VLPARPDPSWMAAAGAMWRLARSLARWPWRWLPPGGLPSGAAVVVCVCRCYRQYVPGWLAWLGAAGARSKRSCWQGSIPSMNTAWCMVSSGWAFPQLRYMLVPGLGDLPPCLPCRAAAKVLLSQMYYSSQLPVVFGLLGPLLAVASLGLWNMWLALDLLLGALQAGVFLVVLLARLACLPRPVLA
jgi:hypothetical protein